MRIKITADSTCDLSEELLAQWDIALMPMHILMGEDSYLDGVTIYPADVFAYVNAGGKMPKSAAAVLHMGKYIGGADAHTVQIALLAHENMHGHERNVPLLQQRPGQITGAVSGDLNVQ